ncbi:HAD family acid phosphatase [Nocardioides sp.]|uniref:HAD family acid phosphatase n=1 Tax=Nocardioides sp. TaxID=35761 RepID=UPI0026315C0D|nr:HAD family acid phosphatase [Nocardioides sp.]
MTSVRRLRIAAATAAASVLLAGCGLAGSHVGAEALGTPGIQQADQIMPVAPMSQSAWLKAVTKAYAHGPNGHTAEAWLAQRAKQASPGQQLAVVLGVDDVIVQTHFAGLNVLVNPSVQFVKTAQQLGYAVFYVTGRSGDTGLDKVENTLRSAGILANGVCGRPVGSASQEQGKAMCRSQIVKAGYTIAMSVAASEISFDGAYPAEADIPLPVFASRY